MHFQNKYSFIWLKLFLKSCVGLKIRKNVKFLQFLFLPFLASPKEAVKQLCDSEFKCFGDLSQGSSMLENMRCLMSFATILLLIVAPTWKKSRNWSIAPLFTMFFANWIRNYHKYNGLQLFVLNVFETIHGLDSGNSSSKTNSKNYLNNIGEPENQRNLQTRNFWTVPKTLYSYNVRLNWAMKLKFLGNTYLVETIKW